MHGTGVCTVTMNDVRNVTASFGPPATVTVEVRNSVTDLGQSFGTNVVTGPNGFRCSHAGEGISVCSLTVAPAAPVTFAAVADPGDSFVRWEGVCGNSTTQCTFTPPPGAFVTLRAVFDD